MSEEERRKLINPNFSGVTSDGSYATINSSVLAPQPQINLPPKPEPIVPNTISGQASIDSYAKSLADIQKQANEIQKQQTPSADTGFLVSLKEQLGLIPKQQSASDLYSQTYGVTPEQVRINQETARTDFNTKQATLKAAQSKFQGISAKLAGITAEAQAIPVQAQQGAEGRGITAGGLTPLTAGRLRENALKALPLQAEALAAQAEIASAQGDAELSQSILEQASSQVDKLFSLHLADSKANFDYRMKVHESIFDFASKSEQRKLDELKSQKTQEYQTQQNNLNQAQSLAETALSSGQSSLAGRLLGLDPNANDYGNQIARLASQISVPQKAGMGGGVGFGGEVALSPLSQSVVSNPSLFYNFTPTQKAQIVSELQGAGYEISELQNAKLSSGQQDDIAQMSTVNNLIGDILAYNSDGKLEGLGAFGLGTIKSLAAQAGFGSEEGQAVRALIGNIKGTIAKLRGGTSFTVNEEKLLNTYTPSVNDSSGVAINKLSLLQDFIAQKNADLLKTATQNITKGQISKKGESVKVENLRTKYKY